MLLTSLFNDFTDEMHNLDVTFLDTPRIVGWNDDVIIGLPEGCATAFAKERNGRKAALFGGM